MSRCEIEIFQEQGSEILAAIGKEKFNLVELGAGDGEKVKFLIEKAVKEEYDFEYVPIDISHGSNLTLAEAVKKISPHIKMTALTSLYEEGIKWAHDNKQGRNVSVCIGSSISNLDKSEREKFFKFMKAT